MLNKYILIMCKESELQSNQEAEVFEQIQAKKNYVFTQLVEKLGPQWTDDDHLNASQIIVDNLEYKVFFNHIIKKASMDKLVRIAFAEKTEGQEVPQFWQSSKDSALLVLIAVVNKFHEKVKNGNKLNTKDDMDDDDQIIIKNDSDEDHDEVESNVISLLAENV